MQQLLDFLKKPQVMAFVTAAVITGLVATGVPARIGLAIPEAALTKTVGVFWLVALGAALEGKYKGDYAGGLNQFLGSTKNRAAFLLLGGNLLNDVVLGPLGYQPLDAETLDAVGNFVITFILAAAGLDSYQAIQNGGKLT